MIPSSQKDHELALKREWYYKNRRKVLAAQKIYNTKHKDKILAKAQAWYHANKERKLKYDRDYRARTREKRRACGLAWYYRNKHKARDWEKRNPDKVRASKRKWEQNNPGKRQAIVKARRARLAGLTIDATASAFYQFVRSKKRIPCYYCGKIISGKEAHIDHVISVKKLGNHCSSNLCASCAQCNHRKSFKTPSEWSATPQMLLNL